MMPCVSVIVPVYGVEPYLAACLDSVQNQTLKDIEVICIDDASPDNCPMILDTYAARDPRFRVVHLAENRQQGYGRNLGMEMARGRYVYFLDADDMIVPEALEQLYSLSERDGLDGVFFDSQVLYDSERLAVKHAYYEAAHTGVYEDRVYKGMELFREFIRQRDWTCYVQRQFWRRDFLTGNGLRFPESTEHEDEWLPFAAVLLAGRVRCIPWALFIRRYRDNSVMTRPADPRDFHGYFRLCCMMQEFLADCGICLEEAEENVGRIYLRAVRFYPVFARSEKPEDWFSEKELPRYRLFEASQKAGRYEIRLLGDLADRLRGFERVYVYGAGVIAERVGRTLMSKAVGIPVEAFLVTDMKNNPEVLCGRPVRALAGELWRPGSVAVIAVTRGYRDEIKHTLEQAGWPWLAAD